MKEAPLNEAGGAAGAGGAAPPACDYVWKWFVSSPVDIRENVLSQCSPQVMNGVGLLVALGVCVYVLYFCCPPPPPSPLV